MPHTTFLTSFMALMPSFALLAHQGQAATLDIYPATSPGCNLGKRPLDPLQHKRKYRLGVHAIRGEEAAYKEYNQVFSDYLTATAGQRFDPPIEFEMVPVSFQGLFDAVAKEEIETWRKLLLSSSHFLGATWVY